MEVGAGDFFPGGEFAGGEVGDGFARFVGGAVVDDREGLARNGDAAENGVLGRLLERDEVEARGGGGVPGGSEDADGVADLGGGQRREGVGSGPRDG